MTEDSISTGFGQGHSPAEKPAESVIATVAEITDQSPIEMPPLAETVDTDALNRLFDTTNVVDSCLTVSFEYYGLEITVESNEVRVEPVNG